MKRSETEKRLLLTLGERVKEVRLLKKISQLRLAALCNTEKTNVSRLENGNTNPTFLTLKKIADMLEVQLCDLIPSRNNSAKGPLET